MFVTKTSAEINAMTDEQRDAYLVAKQKNDAEVVSKMIADEVSKITAKQHEQINELALELQGLKENPTNDKEDSKKQLKDLVSKLSQIVKSGDANSSVVLKTALLRAGITNNSQASDLPNIGQLATRRLSLYDLFPKVQISESNNNGVVRYYDWDEATIARAAASIAEGGTFPESTAKFKRGLLTIEKIGDSLPVSEEFFEDEAMFASELELFLQTNVNVVIDTQLATGDGTSNTLVGIYNSAGTFTASASGIADASRYDLIVKVAESIVTAGGSKYMPNAVIMPTVEINKMRLKKDANYNYILPPFVSRDGQMVENMVVIPCDALSANTMVVCDTRFGRIYEKTGIEVSKGLSGTQFVQDELTIKVRKRLGFLVRSADAGGFKKVTSITAALTTLAS